MTEEQIDLLIDTAGSGPETTIGAVDETETNPYLYEYYDPFWGKIDWQ